MCGISGFFDVTHWSERQARIKAMTDAISYRGPDDSGAWFDDSLPLALGHRRLSILDLSPLGHQPMLSSSGRYVITFNGEIFNFSDIRTELLTQGYSFKGGSDTEVMLAAFEAWGIEAATCEFVGMFAFGVWDRQEKTLTLVRDRLGIKPLYYAWWNGAFLFSSELKALKAYDPKFKPNLDLSALSGFMRFGYVPGPSSIFQAARKLMPGSLLRLTQASLSTYPTEFRNGTAGPDLKRYWDPAEIVAAGKYNQFKGSADEAREDLEKLLVKAVQLRMIADVPVGAFLSGGLDSSLVTALMQKSSTRPVKTFSVGFKEANYDEAPYARAVAKHLGTDHTELYLSPGEAMAVIPSLAQMYDEPFGDSSQIPTFLISKLARTAVTVSLSGDGGDELFAGYTRYALAAGLWKALSVLPMFTRVPLAKLIRVIGLSGWEGIYKLVKPVLPQRYQFQRAGEKALKLSESLELTNFAQLYEHAISHWTCPSELVLNSHEAPNIFEQPEKWPKGLSSTELMMFWDLVTYLPDDILTKVDRASMAPSLEARVPLLDHRLVEFAWRLPLDFRTRDGQTKWLLRRVLERYVPSGLIERPKMGFGIPLGQWLCQDLREWAEDLLAESRLKRQAFLNTELVRTRWTEHLSGRRNWQYPLWNVLMFQAWLESDNSLLAN